MTKTATDEATEFFYQYAGWSYDPQTQTPEQGRRESARSLANAERDARSLGMEFRWSDDYPRDHVAEFDCYDDEPETCEVCVAFLEGCPVASLGCIFDGTAEYRRVIEAELAVEALALL